MISSAGGIALPIPGPVWGVAPERDPAAPRGRLVPPGLKPYRERVGDLVCAAAAAEQRWRRLGSHELPAALRNLRRELRRRGLCAETAADALGAAGAAAARALGVEPYDSQRFAALVLLDGRLAEMATGEGKTLAAALAAAVAALAGTPVHAITANDYLVRRDATELAPLFASLGLDVACVTADLPEPARRAAYGAAIVYCTAKELVFDYLRDGLGAHGRSADAQRRAAALSGQSCAAPLLRGLCMAIIDEADSILVDEATVPLIISRENRAADRRAFLWQSLAIAHRLTPGHGFTVSEEPRRVELTAAGAAELGELAAGLRGPWQRRRYAAEAVRLALTALHVLERDEDYLVRDGRIVLLDQVSGRAAHGRVWSRGLHALLELKEGCPLTPETDTIARITYQQFFPRYVHLCGMSGTIAEAAAELRRTYGLGFARVPLRRPCRRRDLGARLFADAESRWSAVVGRVREMRALGRPVLVGTDSIQDADALGARLAGAGIRHTILHAHNDAAEAAIIASAGQPHQVTVATRMAGRGTDIRLGPGVAEAGGLHVINCQRNASRRLDRQLAGRAGRQGDPGSAELCYGCDPNRGIARLLRTQYSWGIGWADPVTGEFSPEWILRLIALIRQRRSEAAQARIRRHLLQQEREWSRQLTFSRLGL
jgi:preprotein translocase subunit SecA